MNVHEIDNLDDTLWMKVIIRPNEDSSFKGFKIYGEKVKRRWALWYFSTEELCTNHDSRYPIKTRMVDRHR